jgi:hypothetical protein
MSFDPQVFLKAYADAYNSRDPEGMRAFLALDDPRFAVFEDFSGDLLDGATYNVVLESVFDATGVMAFDLLRCDRFGDFAVLHAVQKLSDPEGEDEEALGALDIRATMWLSVAGDAPKIIGGHFSSFPAVEEDGCGCGCDEETETSDGGCCGGHHEGN